jgi:hypothetical protein
MMTTRIACLIGAMAIAAAGLACSGDSLSAPSALGASGASLQPATTDRSASADASAMGAGGPHKREYAHVSNQGGMGIYAANGASIVRQPNGLQASLSMPTPQPGTYDYPPGFSEGAPEVFTLWIFVFNYPELCSHPCDLNDLGTDKPARGGAYNGGGHAVGGPNLTIAGRIGVGETPFDHPVIDMAPLESPQTAEVHLAIAPHGGLDPARLPDEFRLPTGTPANWWVAIFK